MPTNDPITTDRLAACVRAGITTQPALTAAARPVADRIAVLIRQRLPNTGAGDTGAVMLHIAAAYADVMTVLTEQGHPVADAVQIATSAIAMAGTELYDTGDDLCGALPTTDLVSLVDGSPVTAGPCVLPNDPHRDHEDKDSRSWTTPRKQPPAPTIQPEVPGAAG